MLPQKGQMITDYRTAWSGVTPENMENAIEFDEYFKDVSSLLLHPNVKAIVGHNLLKDLKAM